MSFETVSVIGLGYIGLPTAAMFASRKKKVIGVDINQHAVDTINQGKIHIVEPELDIIVNAVVKEGYFKAVTVPEVADAFLIAVPTPFLPCDEGEAPSPDLSYIEAASKAIAPVLRKGNLVILESTSPVGTTEKMAEWLAQARSDLTFPQTHGELADVNVAHCPERVLPGHVVRELVDNDRVIGGLTRKCSMRSIELYKSFVQGDCVVTNARTAEMAKLTENSCRDVQIAFANELSLICDDLDIDVWELIRLANRHPRVNILQPGPGVGGHCIAVDPWFIVDSCPEKSNIIKQARITNDSKPNYVTSKITKLASGIDEPTIACLGLSFKADIDDLRESPAVQIVKKLATEQLGKIIVVEPNINILPVDLSTLNIELVNIEQAIERANIISVLVDHKEFKLIQKDQVENKIIIDTKGIWQ
ncbi:UDP-N-acetyl-D-mannosamine dehydrogenase [Vibrio sp. 10N.261.55.A7]|uniref:UDP-N-acetyl-D-mannosamine dehydrogenase n=1 Tax=Vibrio sp. 10N.261.55.A7 TaxID=1880851 RepID=UPI000C85CDBF|nr:UDP-N-acetyl-D-mannosamine dehydrogenase [Vibrio sp. 10N.261.55.A7]PMK05037.1 UDP-N-acetyl-D-mannosaminuronic acid dehydrogenase [Vibrio sp. 10N.261.55.A7]